MMLPTARAVGLFAGASVVGLLGFATPVALDVLLIANALVIGLVSLDAVLAVPTRLIQVEREAPDSFSVGRPVNFRYRWRNLSPRRRAIVRVREIRPNLLGGVRPARVLSIEKGGLRLESETVGPVRRGRETAGWFAARSIGPFGLGQRQGRLNLPWSVTVYPSLPASRLKASIAEAIRRREVGLRQTRQIGEGRQFESLREWIPGDDPRNIDWKATARRQKTMTRQYEEERRQQVLLVLDAGRLLTADVAGESRMEYVVRAALWLAFAANHHDDNVGVMVIADDVLNYVPPQRGRRGLRQVLDVLAEVEPQLVEPDYPMAFRYLAVRNRKRALTVFFTDVIDRLASAALVRHVGSLRPRHLPLVVTLRNHELERIADERPSTVAGAYEKAAAEEMLAVREEALSQMQAAGAMLVDVSPQNASAAVVEKYLELKRRGWL